MPTFDIAVLSQENSDPDPLIGFVDAYLTEEHSMSMDTTDHPVESGSSIVDNAVKRPDEFRCLAVLSDGLPSPEATIKNPNRRVSELWDILRRFIENRERLIIITRPYTYRNMLLIRANAPIDDKVSRGLRVNLEFREIITVETEIGRFTEANIGGVATDRTGEFDSGTKTLLPADPLILQNPGLSIPQFSDRIGEGLQLSEIKRISAETGISQEDLSLLDKVKKYYGLTKDKINDTVPDRLKYRIDNALGLSRSTQEFNIAVSQLRVLPLSNVSAKQKFTIVLDGLERTVRHFWQPDDGNWYVTIDGGYGVNDDEQTTTQTTNADSVSSTTATAYVQSKRLNGDSRPMLGIVRNTDGEIWIRGKENPGRNAWGITHHAHWGTAKEVSRNLLDLSRTKEAISFANRLL